MPIAAGSMNQRVQFLRRSAGVYAPLGQVQWGRLRYERAVTVNVVGVALQGRGGQLTVRACDLTRGLRVGDRCELDDTVFEITIRKAVEIDGDDIHLEIESAATPALYADEINRRGEVVSLRRVKPNTNPVEFEAQKDVRAIVTGYTPDELSGGVIQGDTRVILLAADVEASGFPLPLKTGSVDSIWFNGRKRTIQRIDDATHRVAGTLLAYDLTVRG